MRIFLFLTYSVFTLNFSTVVFGQAFNSQPGQNFCENVKGQDYQNSDGTYSNKVNQSTADPNMPYSLGVEAFNKMEWKQAVNYFSRCTKSNKFQNSDLYIDAYYYLGVAYYQLKEYDFANDAFTSYLNEKSYPAFFDEVIQYKFAIAEKFRAGAKKRVFQTKRMPKWSSGKSLATEIYGEIALALPYSELASQSLYAKGIVLYELYSFPESIEAFQSVIFRFPKHDLAEKSYLAIAKVYLTQSKKEPSNVDLLPLSILNTNRFEEDFPGSLLLVEAKKCVRKIEESHANLLYETGLFYERQGKISSSRLYYLKAIKDFPNTIIAKKCHRKLPIRK